MKKHPRVFGTTEGAIARAEQQLGRRLPPTFRAWLMVNNGRNLEYVNIFPVLDDRDPRMTSDSIVQNVTRNWASWLRNFEDEARDFSALLPFGDFGTGDYYCFDYSQDSIEPPVVRWSHETGETEPRSSTFTQFVDGVLRGDIVD
jgi:cell wall assembly regulator SMI1